MNQKTKLFIGLHHVNENTNSVKLINGEVFFLKAIQKNKDENENENEKSDATQTNSYNYS